MYLRMQFLFPGHQLPPITSLTIALLLHVWTQGSMHGDEYRRCPVHCAGLGTSQRQLYIYMGKSDAAAGRGYKGADPVYMQTHIRGVHACTI